MCFCSGTTLATRTGAVAIETLKPGDLLTTVGGGAAPVTWLGRQTLSLDQDDPLRIVPIRVTTGALGPDLPARDLLLSPDHAILIGEVLVEAGALVNGTTIVRESDGSPTFGYFHVELGEHTLILADN